MWLNSYYYIVHLNLEKNRKSVRHIKLICLFYLYDVCGRGFRIQVRGNPSAIKYGETPNEQI